MGLIGNFFGLLFSGGYAAKTLLSEKAADRDYERRRGSAEQSDRDIKTLLIDSELEELVGKLVGSHCDVPELVREILSEEISYITAEDDSIELSYQQKKDLIMSKFGKLSWGTLYGSTHFEGLEKVGEKKILSKYDISVRVMQCVESNIKKATGKSVQFGARYTDLRYCSGGNYSGAAVEACGTNILGAIRFYKEISIPYVPISKEELRKIVSSHDWDRIRKNSEKFKREIKESLADPELEMIVGRFLVSRDTACVLEEALREILPEEIAYITAEDDSIKLSHWDNIHSFYQGRELKKGLIMSKFGKLPICMIEDVLTARSPGLGSDIKIGEKRILSNYDISVRAMQCIESNIKNATGKSVLFGVESNHPGIISSGTIRPLDPYDSSIKRIYDTVSIPYVPISKEELCKTNEVRKGDRVYFE